MINPVCFTTKLTQQFENSCNFPLPQVRYTFPLYDGVAVSGYTISYGSKVLKGIVKQKHEAKKTYQAAVDRGETAGLLESLPAGVFGVTLGNLPANTDVTVEIIYCGELKHDAAIDGLRYMLPTSIAPRYGAYPGKVLDSNAESKSGISITVDVDMAKSAVRKVQSPSHPIAVSMGATSTTETGSVATFMPSQASATLTLGKGELNEDFVLQLIIDDINAPQAILETHPTLSAQRALMATLVPRFSLDPIYPEIVFVADQSGSMRGAKNDALVSALKVFLKSLPLGIRFNICAFGNNFQFLFPKAQAYNEDSLVTALDFVAGFDANYGGTEILKPVTAAFDQRLADLPLEVMLLTDGEIWAEGALFSYINEQIHDKGANARVFALGIGGDVSHTLVEGVARAGNGFAQFVTQNEETDQKVIRMLKGALYAHTKDYELEVHYDEKDSDQMSDDDFEIVEKVNECLKIEDKAGGSTKESGTDASKAMSFFDESADIDKTLQTTTSTADRYAHLPKLATPKVIQAPNTIPPLFPFNRSSVYLLLGPTSAQKRVTSITLRATSAQGPLVLNVPVHDSGATAIPTIHRLAARKAVQNLEEGRGWIQAARATDGTSIKKKYESRFDELVERECVKLGEQFQVVGKWTSFVAVEKNEDGTEKDVEPEAETQADEAGVEAFTLDSGPVPVTLARYVILSMVTNDTQLTSSSMRSKKKAKRSTRMDQSPPRFGQAMPCRSTFFPEHSRGEELPSHETKNSTASQSFEVAYSNSNMRASMPMANFAASPFPPMAYAARAAPPSGSFGLGGSGGAPRGPSGVPVRAQLASQAASQAAAQPASQAVHQAVPQSLGYSHFGAESTADSVQLHSDDIEYQIDSNAEATMRALIDLQTFSGAWAWNPALFSTLGISEGAAARFMDETGCSAVVCATALAVAFLETKVSAKKAVWDMVAGKAKGWLATQGMQGSVDEIVAKAATYL